MNYESVVYFSRTWGLLFFAAMLAAVLVYALWPGHKRRFEDAARIPLEDD